MSVEFLLTSLVVVLIPGTGVVYTLAVGLGRGFTASVAAALGCTFGIVPAAVASIVGLAAIFHTSALAFGVIKILGVLYLLYMAWCMLKDDGVLAVNEDRMSKSLFRTALDGTLINVLNPKLSLFFLAFLPQFVDVSNSYATWSMLYLTAVFMLLTFVVFVIYGACAALTRDYVVSNPVTMTFMRRSFAAVFCYLGLRLALAER